MEIVFESVMNARELGGIKCEGGEFRPNMFFRTAELCDASDRDIARMEAFGIRTVFDFRYEHETEETPDRPLSGAVMRKIPALENVFSLRPYEEVLEEVKKDTVGFFCGIYRQLARADKAVGAYREFISSLLSNPGPALVHCKQGKDRTGIAAIVLLSALGASGEDIEADYFMTNPSFRVLLDSLPEETGESDRRFYEDLYTVRPEYLSAYFAEAERMAGSYDAYLERVLGIDGTVRARLREIFVRRP